MGRQPIKMTASDLASYSQCKLCNVVFKTEGVSKSKLIQVYEAHCQTKSHQVMIASKPSKDEESCNLKQIVETQQKQINILINAVKELSKENLQLKEQSMRSEYHYRLLREDLFGRANKYGKEHENMIEYKSFNERLSALENGQVLQPTTPEKKEDAPVKEEPKAEPQEIVKYVNDQNLEEFNPYKIKEKTQFSNTFELSDNTIHKINCFTQIMTTKDEDESLEILEDIQYEIENFDYWLDYIRKNSSAILDAGKINEIKNNIKTITSILEKIIDNFENPKYNMENKAIQGIYKLMQEIACQEWTEKNLI